MLHTIMCLWFRGGWSAGLKFDRIGLNVTSREIRDKYIKFFVERGHKEIPAAPLVLENDPTTLFTSAGMQPLVPYLKGEPHPLGKRLVNSQPSFRSQDIMEVGDNRHTTFFEMLGNWSLGDPASPGSPRGEASGGQGGYFKEEQLPWFFEFLTKELGLPKEKLYVSVFEGNGAVPKDNESAEIWKSLGVPEERIYYYGANKNWWSISGPPEKMPPGEIGGPDSEVFYDFGEELKFHEMFADKDAPCHPNCDCGRFLEIGNSVFIQYFKDTDGSLKELPQKNVDFGGGLERLVAAVNNDPDIFKIDLFWPIIEKIVEITGRNYNGEDQVALRVIADHVKAAVFIIVAGIRPSNKLHGYVLRRLLRRAAVKMHQLDAEISFVSQVAQSVLGVYDGLHGIKKEQLPAVGTVIREEMGRFSKSLERGLKEIQGLSHIDGKMAFDLYQSYGFPLEITEELAREKDQDIDHEEFEKEFEKHRELSRTASAGTFKGGLVEDSPETRKLHTATHLLHKALREVLGEHVQQKGSNITKERLRFDFSHPKPLSELEIKGISELVNQKIKEDLPVTWEETTLDEALKGGALAFFGEKYGDKVKVYSIGGFSKEVCGGPHVEHTGEIGHVTITKEEGLGAGVRRIYAQVDNL